MSKILILAKVLTKNGRSQKSIKNSDENSMTINVSFSDISKYIFPAIIAVGLLFAGYKLPELAMLNTITFADCLVYLSTFASAIVLMFSFVKIINTMYLADDIGLLLTLPLKEVHIAVAKILLVAKEQYVFSGAIFFSFSIGYTISAGFDLWNWIAVVLGFLLVPATVMCLCGTVIVILMRLINAIRNKNLIKIVGSVFAALLIGVAYAVYFAGTNSDNSTEMISSFMTANTDNIAMYYPVAQWIRSIALNNDVASILYLLGVFIFVSLVFIIVLKLFYFKTALLMIGAAGSSKQMTNSELLNACKPKSQSRAIMSRDLKLIVRDSSFLLKEVLLPSAMALAMLVMVFIVSGRFSDLIGGRTGGPGFYTGVSIFFTALVFMNINTAVTSFSREKETFFLTKQLPVDYADLLKGKRNVSVVLSLVMSLLPLLIITGYFTVAGIIPVYYALFAFPINIAMVVFLSDYFVLSDAKNPNFVWDTHDQIKTSGFTINVPIFVIGFITLAIIIILAMIVAMFDFHYAGYIICTLANLAAVVLAIYYNKRLVTKGSKYISDIYIS